MSRWLSCWTRVRRVMIHGSMNSMCFGRDVLKIAAEDLTKKIGLLRNAHSSRRNELTVEIRKSCDCYDACTG